MTMLMLAIVGRVFHWTFRKKFTRRHEVWFWVIVVGCGTIALQMANYNIIRPIYEAISAPAAGTPPPKFHCSLTEGAIEPGWEGSPVSVLYMLKVVNSGGPSVAWRWKLKAEVAGEVITVDARETGLNEVLFDPNTKQQSAKLDNASYLPNCLLETPVGNGAGKSGWVVFAFPTATADDLGRIGNRFTLSFEDCNGVITSITNTITQKGGVF